MVAGYGSRDNHRPVGGTPAGHRNSGHCHHHQLHVECSYMCIIHYMSFPEVSPSYEHSTCYLAWNDTMCGLLATRRHSRKRRVCIYVTKPQNNSC